MIVMIRPLEVEQQIGEGVEESAEAPTDIKLKVGCTFAFF